MKRIASLVLCLLLLCPVLLLPAYAAEEKEHIVESADFEVVLNEDGSADVTETWVVRFISGQFSRFRKEIYTAVTAKEQFTGVSNVWVSIDGKMCIESEKNGFNCVETDDSFIIYANKESRNITRTYIFNYTLENVVKKVGDDKSSFTYRFVGKNHSVPIEKLSVTVSAPSDCKFETEYLSRGTEENRGSIVTYNATDSLGLFKVSLDIHTDNPFGVPYPESGSGSADGASSGPGILALLFNPFTWLIGWFIYKRYKKSQEDAAEKEKEDEALVWAAAHPEEMAPELATLEENLTSSQIASLFLTQGGNAKMIALILAELIVSGHVSLTNDRRGIVIHPDVPAPEQPHRQKVLEFVNTVFTNFRETFRQENGEEAESLPLNYIPEYISKQGETLRDTFAAIKTDLGWAPVTRHQKADRMKMAYKHVHPHIVHRVNNGKARMIAAVLAELILADHLSLADDRWLHIEKDTPEPQLSHRKALLEIVNEAYDDMLNRFRDDPSIKKDALSLKYLAHYINTNPSKVDGRLAQIRTVRGTDFLEDDAGMAPLQTLVNVMLPYLNIDGVLQTTFEDLMDSVKGGRINVLVAISFMCCAFSDAGREVIDKELYYLTGYAAGAWLPPMNTSDSGTGCSSCSSCGGCGGCSGCGGCGGD